MFQGVKSREDAFSPLLYNESCDGVEGSMNSERMIDEVA